MKNIKENIKNIVMKNTKKLKSLKVLKDVI